MSFSSVLGNTLCDVLEMPLRIKDGYIVSDVVPFYSPDGVRYSLKVLSSFHSPKPSKYATMSAGVICSVRGDMLVMVCAFKGHIEGDIAHAHIIDASKLDTTDVVSKNLSYGMVMQMLSKAIVHSQEYHLTYGWRVLPKCS
jgi:hypothetical protein